MKENGTRKIAALRGGLTVGEDAPPPIEKQLLNLTIQFPMPALY
jgi:hypothetical protein